MQHEVILKIYPRPQMSLFPRPNSKDNLVQISLCASQNQKAVAAYFSSRQLLPFGFAEHRGRQRGQIRKDKLGDRCLGFLLHYDDGKPESSPLL